MEVEIGSKLEGTVTGITRFGAFVELPGGATGLVHISEIADKFVQDIHQFLKVGDMVTVKVIQLRDGKISLSIKKAKEPDGTFRGPRGHSENFEDKLSRFLKESEERLASRKRSGERRRRNR